MELQQLLPVGKKVPLGPPTSGEEYLALVRNEALQLPQWTRSEPIQLDTRPTILQDARDLFKVSFKNKLPNELLPTQQWCMDRLADFRNLKRNLTHTKPIPIQGNLDQMINQEDPKLGTILSLNQPKLLNWLARHITLLEKPTERICKWIYCFLVKLDPLMEGQDQAMLRDLVKKVIEKRTTVAETMSTLLDQKETVDGIVDKLFVQMTLLVLIISNEFGQRDLADRYKTI
jgi:hypothetical protein